MQRHVAIRLPLHDDLARAFAHHAARARVHTKLDVREQGAVLACTGEQQGPGGIDAAIVTHISLVGMARHDHIHRRVKPLHDGHDVAAQAVAAGFSHRRTGTATLVQDNDDDICPLCPQAGNQRIHSISLIGKTQPCHTCRVHQLGSGAQRQANQTHGNGGPAFAKALESRGRQQSAAIGL